MLTLSDVGRLSEHLADGRVRQFSPSIPVALTMGRLVAAAGRGRDRRLED